MEVLDKYGPVAVSMDSSDPHFVSYSEGTFGKKWKFIWISWFM